YYKSFDPRTQTYDSVQIGIDRRRAFRAATDRGQLVVGIPFDAGRFAAIDANANIWTAWSAEYVITRVNAAGDTTLVIRRDVPAEPVTGEDLEGWRAMQASLFERAPGIQARIEEL